MSEARARILAIVDAHSLKATTSAYDRGVCVMAVGRAREEIMSIDASLSDEQFWAEARGRMEALIQNYHDNDGEFTSGRSVLVPIWDELSVEE